MPLSEPVSYHVKQKLTRVLSALHATPVSVPITDSQVTYLSGHLSVGFMQLCPGPGCIAEWKCMFFQLLSGIKLKLVNKMMQSNYLCVTLHVKRKKLLIFTVFTWFLIHEKIQDGDQLFWWRHRPPTATPPITYTTTCREDQKLSTEGKIVLKYCNISKTQGGG